MFSRKTLYGKVKLSSDGACVTKKSFLSRKEGILSTDNPLHEVAVLQKVSHPNIIELLGFKYEEKTGLLETYLPFAAHGDMKDWLMKEKKPLPVLKSRAILKQILDALLYLSDQKISHFDVSLENVLIMEKEPAPQVVICDFGCAVSRSTDYKIPENAKPGKDQYRAPEFYSQTTIDTEAADVYSFGICVFELLVNHPPFAKALALHDRMFAIFYRYGVRKVAPGLSEAAYEVLEACLDVDPKKRPTFKKLASFPFFE